MRQLTEREKQRIRTRQKSREQKPAYVVVGTAEGSVGGACVEVLHQYGKAGMFLPFHIITADLGVLRPKASDAHYALDLRDAIDVEHVCGEFNETLELLDAYLAGFIFAAGTNHIAPISDMTQAQFEEVLYLNVTAPWRFTKEVVSRVTRTHISGVRGVYLGSNTAFVSRTNSAAYAASKGGLATMVRSLHRELAPLGFSLMTLDPGPIFGTAMDQKTRLALRKQRGWDDEAYEEMILKNVPGNKAMYAEDVAEQAVWLMMTGTMFGGANIRMDHGQQQG